jgi:hypothetical protein
MRKSCMKRKYKSKHEKFMESVLLDVWSFNCKVNLEEKTFNCGPSFLDDIEFLLCTCNKKLHGSDCVLGPKK